MGERNRAYRWLSRAAGLALPGIIALVSLGGCQQAAKLPGEAESSQWLGGEPASVAMVPGAVQSRLDALRAELGPAWWETRRDRLPYVEAGYASSVVAQSEVVTYDGQSTYDGRVVDHYHQRRRSVEYSQIVR